jgi:hypothetical protein
VKDNDRSEIFINIVDTNSNLRENSLNKREETLTVG